MPHRYDNREEHRGLAFFLAVVMHGLLAAFLLISVQWKTHKPETVMVELWGGPPPAAQKIVAPEVAPLEPKPEIESPAQEKPDIVTEKIKPTLPPKATAKPAAAPTVAPTRPAEPKAKPEENSLLNMLQQGMNDRSKAKPGEGKSGGTGTNPQAVVNTGSAGGAGSGVLDEYKGRLVALFKSRLIYPEDKPGNPQTELKITVLPDGSIRDVVILKPSSDPAYDEAARRAVRAVDRLPDPGKGHSFRDPDLREFRIVFRLREKQ